MSQTTFPRCLTAYRPGRPIASVAATEAGEALLATLAPAPGDIESALDTLSRGRDRVAGTLRLTMTRQAYEAVIRPDLSGLHHR